MRLPAPFRSVRTRLAILYSVALFGVALVLIAVVNVALSQSLESQQATSTTIIRSQLLSLFGLPNEIRIDQALTDAEAVIRQQTLDNLRIISAVGLAALLPVSFVIGWLVAGRVLRPIDQITEVARDIGATDLSRRIRLDGPDDELHRLADTFDDMLERLDRSARAQRTFVEDASHELRNPLAVMRTSLDVALADADDTDGLRTAAEVSRRAADRMARTVDDLVAFIRNEAEHPTRDPVDLGPLVVETCEEYRALALEGSVSIATVIVPSLVVEADRDAVKRALANLLANAVRVAPARTTIHAGAGRLPGWVWLGVRDLGPGIPADEQPLVFRRAWREGRPVTPGEGRGIGLALVRQIAEAHGGTVSVTSAVGAGASFIIWLPTRGEAGGLTLARLAEQPDPLWGATGTADAADATAGPGLSAGLGTSAATGADATAGPGLSAGLGTSAATGADAAAGPGSSAGVDAATEAGTSATGVGTSAAGPGLSAGVDAAAGPGSSAGVDAATEAGTGADAAAGPGSSAGVGTSAVGPGLSAGVGVSAPGADPKESLASD